MVFGEIIEPSTRALINDELDEYPEYTTPEIEWSVNFQEPKQINKLIFVETTKVKTLFTSLILGNAKPVTTLPDGYVEIYELPNNAYVISYTEKKLTTGEITEILSDYIKSAKQIYAFTSASVTTYQNSVNNKPESFVRMLSTPSQKKALCPKLESPNLVTGLGAQILSYCIHTGLECSLFVLYMDPSPIDSVNANPFIQLAKSLDLNLSSQKFVVAAPANNLYL